MCSFFRMTPCLMMYLLAQHSTTLEELWMYIFLVFHVKWNLNKKLFIYLFFTRKRRNYCLCIHVSYRTLHYDQIDRRPADIHQKCALLSHTHCYTATQIFIHAMEIDTRKKKNRRKDRGRLLLGGGTIGKFLDRHAKEIPFGEPELEKLTKEKSEREKSFSFAFFGIFSPWLSHPIT